MKLIILTLCVAGAFGRPDVSHVLQKNDESHANIIEQNLDVNPEGKYQWGFRTDNGIQQEARGALDNPQAENPALHVEGQSQYTAPNGENVVLSYTADENGYQVQGSHLPTSPPIPEAIQRSLEFIRAHPPAPETR